ncbi:MAG: ATP-dependent DNA helicase RecG [Candidatus Omnitrophica bacterium]|nr:ATP-dependent DNA helicase RecG [Candidatus Omnitrophota bacterium]MDD5670654.1 ATP-dependent DNA helicase RecG [Candidatus Omnitrophota bacterium]
MDTEVLPVNNDVRYLKGVGPKRALALERIGIRSVRDLLCLFPRRYEDRSHFRAIADIALNDAVTLRGEVLKVTLKPIRRMMIVEIVVGDDSGMIYAIWFNQPYLKKQFTVGQEIILYGKVEYYKGRFQITSPEYELVEGEEESVHTGRITPIYPLTEGLFQRSLRTTLRDAVQTQLDKVVREYLPESFCAERKLMELREAVREMHFPTSFEKLAEARKRIVFDEFLVFEVILLERMERLKTKHRASVLTEGERWLGEFEKKLPFRLTNDQNKVMRELFEDLGTSVPMNRLLQGDVGAGKTLVAVFAMLLAAKNQSQAAMLVPTEILAEQHYQTLQKVLAPFSLSIGLLTSSTPAVKRERMLAELKQGKLDLLVGTHAMLQEDVVFKSLGLVIVDEQHKFGVHQRCALLNREPRPHQLVMTATPIPRTLAFTIFGDLAISTIRELPAGRKPIQTYWVTRDKQKQILERILEKTKKGEQAYFIFPLIEETEKLDLLAAEKEYEKLSSTVFSDLKVGLVHGRMSREERDSIMSRFRTGDIQVLVATSVIEVGVDHPNATMMVIENAERFGLAQLHQMRGRIGRGEKPSECFLFGEPNTEEGQKRLRILTKTQDGFVIAEEDLRLRGPGDFLGTRQSGEPYFRVADPLLDEAILRDARNAAMHLVKQHMLDVSSEWQGFKKHIQQMSLNY